MENKVAIGMNRTGMQMSPLHGGDMAHHAQERLSEAPKDGVGSSLLHRAYVDEADAVGTVPVPGTVKGMASTGMGKMMGKNPEVFIDKLGERLAFERTGTRLYDALLMKCDSSGPVVPPAQEAAGAVPQGATMSNAADEAAPASPDVAELMTIRAEEERHFILLQKAMVKLGADPTAMTPCADVAGVASLGLLQVVSDPRTTISQCLNAVLIAELTDNAGWELLTDLAREQGHSDMAEQFQNALAEEQNHLALIKGWLRHGVLTEAS
ncbi:MAG: hypothetical protein JWR80_6360 [Bradyrhizobium sp.]|nr:hypothetical protein [Bradyrhizobium sp.]